MPKRRRAAYLEAARERSRRMAIEGLKLEDRIERILRELKIEGRITAYQRHAHFSSQDMSGRDFTVAATVLTTAGPVEVRRSFGVSVSPRSCMRANTNHPNTPTFWFPPETEDERIRARILVLLQGEHQGMLASEWSKV